MRFLLRLIISFHIIIALIISSSSASFSQGSGLSIGLEQDILPYATGGYYAGIWAGKSHVRARALLAHVNKPDFITPDGFTNNVVNAYALTGDYFFKSNWSGWWIGGGLVIWNSSIQSNQQLSTVYYDNFLLNGSIGYNWKFYKNFYLSPWAGMHIRVGGAQTVTADGASFDTPLLNPEASLKVGWYFNSR